MTVDAQVVAPPLPALPLPVTLFHRIWPAAGLGIGVIATVAWSGFLGYELFRLVF
jgi:hypothetical protein